MASQGGWNFYVTKGATKAGVVVIHEIYGLNDYIRSVARDFAASGYSAAAVDLFKGQTPTAREEGFKLRDSLTREQLLDAFGSGQKLLRQQIGSGAKVGIMGFCMGGGQAQLGASNLDFDFCVSYYGAMQNPEEINGMRGPAQVIVASEDERITPWTFQSLLPAANRYKKRVDVHLYPNAAHGFHRPAWDGHNAAAAKDAWQKTISFMSQFR